MKMLLSFLNKFRRHRAVLAPIRLTSFFSMAALLFAMTVVTPTTTFAQRGSTSKGGVERNSKAQSRKSGIAARSTSSRSDSRATPSQSSSKRAQSSSKRQVSRFWYVALSRAINKSFWLCWVVLVPCPIRAQEPLVADQWDRQVAVTGSLSMVVEQD